MTLVPKGRNKILLRLENIADKFDNAATEKIDLGLLAQSLWQRANPCGPEYASVSVEEMSLTGNMPVKERLQKHMTWQTGFKAETLDQSSGVLEPQRIRVYLLNYVAVDEAFLQ